MASLLDLCERYFSTRNYYDALKIPKNANDKQVKKAYHKLSLTIHPDRVKDNIKAEATEKFKVLGGIYSILSDNEKRKVYDQFIQYDEEIRVVMRKLTNYLLSLVKKMSTVNDINNYEKLRLSSEVASCLFLLKRGNYDKSRQYDESKQYNESEQYNESRQYNKSRPYTKSKQYNESREYNKSKQYNESRQYNEYRQYNKFKQYNESRQYEEIKIIMSKLIDYLEPSLKEISTVKINNNEKLSLLVSLQLFLMKRSLISIRQQL